MGHSFCPWTRPKSAATLRRMPEPSATRSGAERAGGDDPRPTEWTFDRSFELGKDLPLDVLPPETIARLRAGGQTSPEELAMVQSAALADAGPLGKLVQAFLAAQPPPTTTAGETSAVQPGSPVGDGGLAVVPGSVRTYEWRWPGERKPTGTADDFEPATYYEALTGKRDPQRDFFITARRILKVGVWLIALGLPIGLVALAITAGQSGETLFVVGLAAFIVGMMFKASFPRTPFD